jgi:hypothetical protein
MNEALVIDPRPGCHPKTASNYPTAKACNRLCMEGIERCPRHKALDEAKARRKAQAKGTDVHT